MGLWQKIKEIVQKMLPKKSIDEVFHVMPAMSDRMQDAIQLWSDMYEGNSPWLKEPNYNDPTRITSLGLPALIASEKARMVTIEMKSEISPPMMETESVNADTSQTTISDTSNSVPVGSTARAEFLEKNYKKLKRQIRRQLEYGIAKGGLVIKPYIVEYKDSGAKTDKFEIEFDYVQADRFFPLSFDANGKVIEAAFVQTKVDKAKERVFIRLEYHKLEGRKVIVQNLAFESTDMSLANSNNIRSASHLGNPIPLTDVAEWSTLQAVTEIEDVDRLLFAYFRMPEANTVDPYSPLGVSGYSRVVNLIRDADTQYSRLLWEFEGGELAIDVDRDALSFVTNSDGTGRSELSNLQKRLFRKVDLNAEDTYNVFAPTLRDASITSGLNTILTRIEDVCGISRGTISNVQLSEARTATELKILKQRSFATNADIQMALQDALEDTIYVMDVYCTLYNVTSAGDYEVSFEWDDSILVDSESELTKRLTLLQNKIESRLETRMWYFGETENQAKAALQKVDDESRIAMAEQLRAQAEMASITGANSAGGSGNPTGTQVPNPASTSKKVSTGKQADSLDNPSKTKTAQTLKN